LGWRILEIAWGFAFAAPLLVALLRQVPREHRGRIRFVGLLVTPALAILAYYANRECWPFRLTFLYSRPALERFAHEQLSRPIQVHYPDTRVGLFRLTGIYVLNDEIGFEMQGNPYVLIFSPGKPQKFKPLGKDWYFWDADWNRLENRFREIDA